MFSGFVLQADFFQFSVVKREDISGFYDTYFTELDYSFSFHFFFFNI